MIRSLINNIVEDKPIDISNQLLFDLGQITIEEFKRRQDKMDVQKKFNNIKNKRLVSSQFKFLQVEPKKQEEAKVKDKPKHDDWITDVRRMSKIYLNQHQFLNIISDDKSETSIFTNEAPPPEEW